MRIVALFLTSLVLSSAILLADDHCVLTDDDLDYSIFKTFTVAAPKVSSERPELNFPALARTLVETATKALTATGLKETRAAQLTVVATITTVDYSRGSFGAINVVRNGRSGPGGRPGAQVDFSEATLVIDLMREGTNALAWRGVFHDAEDTGQRLADALPKDAAFLLSQFPPKKR